MAVQNENEGEIEGRDKSRNDHYYSRLRAFDKHYLEKSSLVIFFNFLASGILNK